MTPTDTIAIPAARAAATKLANLRQPHIIELFQAGDNDRLCSTCLVGIEPSATGWRHSGAEIRQLREIAGDGWPR